MKVFISWSGERSRLVAELLDEWIKCVLQACDPWISSKDIDRGTYWFSEIISGLDSTVNGIICLTNENVNNPWILFEAGALAKGISDTRVCTFLIDLEPHEIKDPLAQFNHTMPNRSEVSKLVESLNKRLGEKALPANVLERVFSTYWPQFEEQFNKILTDTTDSTPKKVRRNQEDMLREVLFSVRSFEKRIRSMESEKTKKVPNFPSFLELQEYGKESNLDSIYSNRFYHDIKKIREEMADSIKSGYSLEETFEKMKTKYDYSSDALSKIIEMDLGE